MLRRLTNSKKGFTIIEVMIVLAIAGVIMLIVLVAIPQLQRNARNTARRDRIGRIKAEVDNYASNNGGQLPTTAAAGTSSFVAGFRTRYMGCSGTPEVCTVNIEDPSSGTPMTFTTGAAAPTDTGSVNYRTGTVCSGESPTTTGAGGRNYTVQTYLEGGALFCLDNK